MKRLFRSEDGYVLIFTIMVLPVFFGFVLLILDIGRGNNAHGDLQASADAIALAGARELDGGPTAIPRAKTAMANVVNSVSMLGIQTDTEIRLEYEDTSTNEFYVVFLTDIPADDLTEIDAAWLSAYSTGDSTAAEFIYVRAQSRNLETFSVNPVSLLRQEVPIAVYAAAKAVSAACKIPPIYICNPFEYDSSGNYVGDQLQSRFNAGDLHGRMVRLHPSGNATESPGNFGFLQVNGSSSASAISAMFAGATNPTCYDSETVTTAPGAKTGVAAAVNTRFDIYAGSWGNNSGYIPRPAVNVRKGALPKPQGNNLIDCVQNNGATLGDDHIYNIDNQRFNDNQTDDYAYGLPDNLTMSPPNQALPGGAIGTTSNWAINTYFAKNYGPLAASPSPTDPHPNNVVSAFAGQMPSRYDVYRAEIDNGWYNLPRGPGDPNVTGNTGELGNAECGANRNPQRTPDMSPTALDRRVIVGAIVDCKSQSGQGGGINNYVVNSYGSFFMTRPMHKPGSTFPTIDIEVIDITGSGSNGTLETFVRNEAILVR